MIELLIVVSVAVAVWGFRRASRRGGTPEPPLAPALAPAAALAPRPRRRLQGRRVEAAPAAIPVQPPPRPKRLHNGERVPAVRRGRVVVPPDAIGLGCLKPIAACTLGDRCVCRNQPERRVGGL